MIEDSERCQTCGTANWEWELDPRAYEVIGETCMGCYHLEYMQDSGTKAPGVRMNLSPTKTVEAAKRQVKAEQRWLAGEQS